MEHNKGLERQLQERVNRMRLETREGTRVPVDDESIANAEPTGTTPTEFGKAP